MAAEQAGGGASAAGARLLDDIRSGEVQVRATFDWTRLGVVLLLVGVLIYGLVLAGSARQFPFEEVVGRDASRRWSVGTMLVVFAPIAVRLVIGLVAREPVVLLDTRGTTLPGLVSRRRWIVVPIDGMSIEVGDGSTPALVVSGGPRPLTLRRYSVRRR